MGVPNRGPQLIAVVSVLLAFSITAIILRCYVRISLVKAFGVDDYLMVFAMVGDGQLRRIARDYDLLT